MFGKRNPKYRRHLLNFSVSVFFVEWIEVVPGLGAIKWQLVGLEGLATPLASASAGGWKVRH